ncbi:hypothetical protein [Echinicola sp. 20G]|uniref:hypothetical protein n=1 Tax=Echinicola sp. 20G TaxID=2781961 RepID=UPI0019102E6E|nr:hypothetical protein [Echinicola sp. 20G]
MKRIRIHCSIKINRGPLKGTVERIGGINNNGEKWNISIQEALKGTKSGLWEFYVLDNNVEVTLSAEFFEKLLTPYSQNENITIFNELEECPL